MYDPFNDDYLYAPLCKEEYSPSGQPEDVLVEPNSFFIQPPGQVSLYAQHHSSILQQLQQQQLGTCPTKPMEQENDNLSPECQLTGGCLAQLDFDVRTRRLFLLLLTYFSSFFSNSPFSTLVTVNSYRRKNKTNWPNFYQHPISALTTTAT